MVATEVHLHEQAENLDNLKSIENNPNYKFVEGDICDKYIVESLVKDCDIIINFAAETHVDRSIKNADEFIKSNITGVNNLLESIKLNPEVKLVHISTDEVYGSIESGSFDESSKLNPKNPYSASKASAEFFVNSFINTHNIKAIMTRSSNNFGPYINPEKLIPLMITNALENKELPVYGNGTQVRDWLYIEDNCRAIKLVMEKGKLGEVYNITAKNEISNIELVKSILRILKKPESLIRFVKDRPGHDKRYSITNEKIKNLGWKPKYSFNNALKITVNWYLNNKEWVSSAKSGEYMEYYKKQYLQR